MMESGHRAVAFKQLVTLLEANVPAQEAVWELSRVLPVGTVRTEFQRAAKRLRNGARPQLALRPVVPSSFTSLIEDSSDDALVQVLGCIADHLERRNRLQVIMSATAAYPLRLAFGCLIFLGVGTWIGRALKDTIGLQVYVTNMGVVVPVEPSDARPYGVILFVILLVLMGNALWAVRKGKMADWARFLPDGRRFTRAIWLSEFMSVMAVSFNARQGRTSTFNALTEASRVIPHQGWQRQLKAAAIAIQGGKSLISALIRIGNLPSRDVLSIAFGARLGKPAEAAQIAADRLEKEAAVAGQCFVGWFGVILFLVAGAMVALIALVFTAPRLGEWVF